MHSSLVALTRCAAALLAPGALSCVTLAGGGGGGGGGGASASASSDEREVATVIFARPSLCQGDGAERLVMCDAFTQNRILVVDGDGRRIAELGPRDYAVTVQKAGEHMFIAQESGTSCSASRPQCVAVLPAALEAGRTYVVAFVWHPVVRKGTTLTMGEGRLDFAPISAQTMPIVERWMETAMRVDGELAESGSVVGRRRARDARSRALAELAERRLAEDRREHYPTPRIDSEDGS